MFGRLLTATVLSFALTAGARAQEPQQPNSDSPSLEQALGQVREATALLLGPHDDWATDIDRVSAMANEAAEILRPIAEATAADSELTEIQRAYATALALLSAADASDGVAVPAFDPSECALSLTPADYDAEFPRGGWRGERAIIAIAVLRVITDESGGLERADVAAALPEGPMSRVGRRLARRLSDSGPWKDGCMPPRVQFRVLRYRTLPDAD